MASQRCLDLLPSTRNLAAVAGGMSGTPFYNGDIRLYKYTKLYIEYFVMSSFKISRTGVDGWNVFETKTLVDLASRSTSADSF